MSKSPTRIKLGPLPKVVPTKVTFACPDTLKAELERYAELHALTHGEQVEDVALIPHMLDTFMNQDRLFKTRRP